MIYNFYLASYSLQIETGFKIDQYKYTRFHTVLVSDVLDLIEISELKSLVPVDRWPDVFAVIRALHLFQLAYATHIRQSGLNIR